MQTFNRAIIRDALKTFLLSIGGGSYADCEEYREGAHDLARFLQEQFPEEKNVHLSKSGETQNLYRFHYKVGVLATSKEKWMSPKKAEAYAAKNGYRLELIRTTHKAV